MIINNLGNRETLLDQFISEIRDEQIQQDRLRFRNNLKRIGEIFSYEISKKIVFESIDVSTPLGIANVPVIKEQPVIATFLRAGLGFHDGFLSFFDKADSAFIAGYRKFTKADDFEIKVDYTTSPELDNRVLIINDAMLASGASFEIAYKGLLNYGKPKQVILAAIIASKEGLEYIQKVLPDSDISIYVGAIDDELTVKSYIVPGLGDAGDLCFGKKTD